MSKRSACSVALESDRLCRARRGEDLGEMSEQAGRSTRAQDRAVRLIELGLKGNEISRLVRKHERERGGERRYRDGRALDYAIRGMQSPRPERCGMGLILVCARKMNDTR
jgi:hypothetical protein